MSTETAELYPYDVGHDTGCVCTPCVVAILREVRGDYAIDPEPFARRLFELEKIAAAAQTYRTEVECPAPDLVHRAHLRDNLFELLAKATTL